MIDCSIFFPSLFPLFLYLIHKSILFHSLFHSISQFWEWFNNMIMTRALMFFRNINMWHIVMRTFARIHCATHGFEQNPTLAWHVDVACTASQRPIIDNCDVVSSFFLLSLSLSIVIFVCLCRDILWYSPGVLNVFILFILSYRLHCSTYPILSFHAGATTYTASRAQTPMSLVQVSADDRPSDRWLNGLEPQLAPTGDGQLLLVDQCRSTHGCLPSIVDSPWFSYHVSVSCAGTQR